MMDKKYVLDKVYHEKVMDLNIQEITNVLKTLSENEMKQALLGLNEISKAILLIKFEENNAIEDKKNIEYIFDNDEERALFLIDLADRIKALKEIRNFHFADNTAHHESLNKLIENLYFIYVVEGGNIFEIDESGEVSL